MYYVWVRIDSETRMMKGCTTHVSIVQAHEFAYEIDCDGKTVYISEKSKAILNGGQYGLFGV